MATKYNRAVVEAESDKFPILEVLDSHMLGMVARSNGLWRQHQAHQRQPYRVANHIDLAPETCHWMPCSRNLALEISQSGSLDSLSTLLGQCLLTFGMIKSPVNLRVSLSRSAFVA